jgi:hypothetical protein
MEQANHLNMKRVAGWLGIFSLFLLSFKPASIDEVATAIRSGNVDRLSVFFDYRVDITLPEKSDTYSKSQAEMIIRDFFKTNIVRNFRVKLQGENAGLEYCVGVLQTHNGDYRTSLFMRQKGAKLFLEEIRFQPLQ